jgi:predicted DNA binding CopG/RHH family protein
MKTKRPLPKFKNVEEESIFWRKHSILEFVDETEILSFLRQRNRSKAVSLRMEPVVLEQAKRIAETRAVKYQTLIREWIYEGLEKEIASERPRQTDIEILTELVMDIGKNLEDLRGEIITTE